MTLAPQISVIIPTSKPLTSISRTLESISRYASEGLEVLVVQNGLNENPNQRDSYTTKLAGFEFRIIQEEVPGLLAGRHRGVKESQFDILTFIDDDVEVDEHWLQAISNNFRDTTVDLVGGPSSPLYESPPPDWLEKFVYRHENTWRCSYLSLLDYGNERKEIDPSLIWGLNFSIRRNTLLALGGFHPDGVPWRLRQFRGNGEAAVTTKAKASNKTAIYDPNVSVVHIVPKDRLSIEYIEKRSYLQGISDSYSFLRKKHKEQSVTKPATIVTKRERAVRLAKKLLKSPEAPADTALFKSRVAYQKGYQFHQRQFHSNKLVQDWVLRPDYWTYSYPK
ncbi:glycosyltransferase family 2 protein [Rhodopirellula sallentina]|uniref:Glycosyl transferase family protein n=1 Tax=Rhodopirellula sallentina SM41 TaxID=1263870 RepID=M5UFF7_9BACT|nr:glycosyltransferase family 2 protein [Rhodopirellula sallentina]EMI54708.1 glycosyl transferase family protein [Rhodopirellula sallentina SM41]